MDASLYYLHSCSSIQVNSPSSPVLNWTLAADMLLVECQGSTVIKMFHGFVLWKLRECFSQNVSALMSIFHSWGRYFIYGDTEESFPSCGNSKLDMAKPTAKNIFFRYLFFISFHGSFSSVWTWQSVEVCLLSLMCHSVSIACLLLRDLLFILFSFIALSYPLWAVTGYKSIWIMIGL